MDVRVIKRDGRIEPFYISCISNALQAAGWEVLGDRTVDEGFNTFAFNTSCDIYNWAKDSGRDKVSVEEIQDKVEEALLNSKYKTVAQAYIRYRQKRTDVREQNSQIFKTVKEKLDASNVVNQNANVDEYSFGGRMGEARDAVLRDYALKHCMSELSRNNHLNNEIYVHDLNSYPAGMHNCYDANTRFITHDGVRTFKSCNDGEVVKVLAIDGEWREATVRKYGKQKMYKLTFKSSLTRKTVTCTRNHRWVLDDGTVVDNINVGDSLALTPKVKNNESINDNLWCIGFVLGDGCDIKLWSKDKSHVTNGAMKIRLCGDKTSCLPTFLKCGWSVNEHFDNGDVTVYTSKYGEFKQKFLDDELWKIMSHNDLISIFKGYIDADGFEYKNGSVNVCTSDKRLLEFIRYASSPSGYFLWSQRFKHNDTNFKKDREIWDVYLVEKQSTKWTLEKIESSEQAPQTAWCVEEPVTHTFTLDGAMVTGNCLSIPFDDLLAKGFNTRQTDVRPAKSVNTAMQLVAVISQLQSLVEFGGVAATHLDWTMVPYVRLSFNKHFIDGIKYLYRSKFTNWPEDSIREVSIDSPKYKEWSEAYKYAMDMTNKETYQAVEGLYHNLNTLQSRSGNQLPFTSINYGTCTLPEGRMVIKALLDVSIKGIGKLHRTPIFPCGIFQYMKGVNDKPGTPNYDMFRLALKSTSKRLYPNYCNVDWSGNKGYDRNDPRTYTATMG